MHFTRGRAARRALGTGAIVLRTVCGTKAGSDASSTTTTTLGF